jgi:hypothetical protein
MSEWLKLTALLFVSRVFVGLVVRGVRASDVDVDDRKHVYRPGERVHSASCWCWRS